MFNTRKKSPLDQRVVQTKTNTAHDNLMTDLMLSEPNDYKILFVRFDGPLFDGHSRLNPTVAKETLTGEKHSHLQSTFIHYATLFGHWKGFGSPKMRKGHI